MPKKEIITEIEGRKLKLSNLNKLLYPEIGIIKAEFIQYYLQIAPYILPHLNGRPLTLKRYPEGVDGHKFYSKNKPSWTPDWIDSIQLSEESDNTYVMVSNTASLLWMANLAALELHPMQTTSKAPNRPDHFIFDLDPPESADFKVVRALALRLKSFLESYCYHPFVKTSGSNGLHVYVPIVSNYNQDEVLNCIRDLAIQYVKIDKGTTLKMNKDKRNGKVLLDIFRNHKSQTCIAPYSTRGKRGAPISAPIYWEELKYLESSQAYSINTIVAKLAVDGDPWADYRNAATGLHTNLKNTSKAISVVKKSIFLDGKSSAIDDIDKRPMLATLGSKVLPNKNYSYEVKWDGIRIIIIKDGERISLLSRKGNDLTDKFPNIQKSIKKQSAESFIVDGELVFIKSDGTPDFSKIVGRMHLNDKDIIKRTSKIDSVNTYLFDILYYEGRDIRNQTLEDRRKCLEDNIEWNKCLKFSLSFDDGRELLEAVKIKGMEGIMCKLKGSRYESNTRSSSWIKVKNQFEDEALIIGYTLGKGERSNLFGALHLAKMNGNGYDYYGKVGTGFNETKMKEIFELLSQLNEIKKPITEMVDDERNTIWIDPVYSCKLKYASLSNNVTYREPVFLKLCKTH